MKEIEAWAVMDEESGDIFLTTIDTDRYFVDDDCNPSRGQRVVRVRIIVEDK